MAAVTVANVTAENLPDLLLCVPPEKRSLPALETGIEAKRQWALAMLNRSGTFGKIAYKGSVPTGLIQFGPLASYRGVYIYCLYVAERAHWRQGIGTKLLASLIDDIVRPHAWFGYRPALALLARPLPGEKAGQFPARSFYLWRGFRPIDGSGTLYYPLSTDVSLAGLREAARSGVPDGLWGSGEADYIPMAEDRGKAVLIFGPCACPYTYTFLQRAEQYVRDLAPEISVRWIAALDEPSEVERRGGFIGCVVNARPIKTFVLDKQGFQREVRQALGTT
ncbi:MAG TPA: GNAT family N-acetyltransferase [bacterium]|nr:GNAT family N-acetyltransferase [bacterium]